MNPAFIAKSNDAATGLLSCLRQSLLETGAMCKTMGLTATHFPQPQSEVFTALMETWKEGGEYDWLNLQQQLRAANALRMFGNKDQLRELLYSPASISAAESHIEALLECTAARRMFEIGQKLVARALEPSEPTSELLRATRADLELLEASGEVRETRLGHFAEQWLEKLERSVHTDTGEALEFGLGLDEGAGPFCRGDLIVICGKTKAGKSALANNIVENLAEAGRRCCVFSLEMSGEQNAERNFASQSLINTRDLKQRIKAGIGDMLQSSVETELRRLRMMLPRLAAWKIEMIEKTRDLRKIVAKMKQLKASADRLDVTVVDYAQRVRGIRGHGENREREVASISDELKAAAMDTDSIVILLSQLNEDGKLRESRALGQDANCVLGLEGEGPDRIIRVVAARSAPVDEIPIRWQAEFTRFSRA